MQVNLFQQRQHNKLADLRQRKTLILQQTKAISGVEESKKQIEQQL